MMKEKSIELNPDGTFPYQKFEEREVQYFTATSSTASVLPEYDEKPRKRTWKEILDKEILPPYLLLALVVGTLHIFSSIIKLIIWIIKFII